MRTIYQRISSNGLVRLVFLMVILSGLFLSRYYYGKDIVLSGDEVGVGVHQAVGKWDLMKQTLPEYTPVSMDSVRYFVSYSSGYGISEVTNTLWKDKLHPPLYFILLHFYIRLFGNDPVLLRSFSIVISLISVLMFYRLAKLIFGTRAGWIAGLMMAISPYCLEYSVMVRVYPLEMALAILSTYLLIRMIKNGVFSLKDRFVIGYIIASIAGLYTYYSFSVVLLSHFVLLLLFLKPFTFRRLLHFAVIFAIILLSVIPWVIPFLQGVGHVGNKDFYFMGSYTMSELFHYFFRTLFFPYDTESMFLGNPALVNLKTGISVLLMLALLAGIVKARRDIFFRNYFISVFLYITISVINDKVFKTNTFIFDRQHYYTIPALLLVFAGSFDRLSSLTFYRAGFIFILIVLLTGGFIYRFSHKSVFDGPAYFTALNKYLDEEIQPDEDRKYLVMMNMRERRYLLPFVYSSDKNFDLLIIPRGFPGELEAAPVDFTKYKGVFGVNILLNERKSKRLKLKVFQPEKVDEFLNYRGFKRGGQPFIFKGEETLNIYKYTRQNPVAILSEKTQAD